MCGTDDKYASCAMTVKNGNRLTGQSVFSFLTSSTRMYPTTLIQTMLCSYDFTASCSANLVRERFVPFGRTSVAPFAVSWKPTRQSSLAYCWKLDNDFNIHFYLFNLIIICLHKLKKRKNITYNLNKMTGSVENVKSYIQLYFYNGPTFTNSLWNNK